ncbi:MAG: putative transposase for insertion sequence element [candidate division NC10 bacterium]|nr:putative transposase for insertion sequence element [candidate division NC10 bacterium]
MEKSPGWTDTNRNRQREFRRPERAVTLHTVLVHDGWLPARQPGTWGEGHQLEIARPLEQAAGSVLIPDLRQSDDGPFGRPTTAGGLCSARLKWNARFPVARIRTCDPETGERLELRTHRLVLGASTIAALRLLDCFRLRSRPDRVPFNGVALLRQDALT